MSPGYTSACHMTALPTGAFITGGSPGQSLVHSSTCCSSLGDVGCSGFPVCQPCLSQHPHQRSISPVGFWIWGLPLVSLLFFKKHDFSFYVVIFIWQSYDKLSCPNLDRKKHKISLFYLSFSMQSCWPWCWQHLLNTFCTLSTWTVRIPGKIRLSTCSILSSSQVLYKTYSQPFTLYMLTVTHWLN